MLSERWVSLLGAMAEALDDGCEPFSQEFLTQHNVSLDECFGLSSLLATIIRGFVNSDSEAQTAFVVAGCAETGIDTSSLILSILAPRKLRDICHAFDEAVRSREEQLRLQPCFVL